MVHVYVLLRIFGCCLTYVYSVFGANKYDNELMFTRLELHLENCLYHATVG